MTLEPKHLLQNNRDFFFWAVIILYLKHYNGLCVTSDLLELAHELSLGSYMEKKIVYEKVQFLAMCFWKLLK